MTLRLVTGPPGAGKTERVLERVAAEYARDAFASVLVLVPTSRHADQFRRRLVARCGAAFGLEVATLTIWTRDLAAARGQPVASRAVAGRLTADALRAAVAAGEAEAFASVAATPGFAATVAEALAELIAEDVALGHLSGATLSPRLQALAAVYRQLGRELERVGFVHPAAAAATAAAIVAREGASAPLVAVDGFDYLRSSEIGLVAALAGRSEVLLTLDPSGSRRATFAHQRLAPLAAAVEEVAHRAPTPRQRALSAADREGELRAIARDIKERLTADRSLRPSDFAIAFRQVTPVLPLARQVFAEYNLPLDAAAGTALADLPFGTWVRRLLTLGTGGWRTRDLLAVLRSGFCDRRRWALDRSHVALIGAYARSQRLWGGAESLDRISQGLLANAGPDEAARERARRAGGGLAALLARLRPLLDPGVTGREGEHAARLEEALFGREALARPQAGARAHVDAFRRLLRERAEASLVAGGGDVTFAAFAAGLVRDMGRPSLALREAGGVVLAPVHTLHGLRFRYVALAGLAENEFPAPRRVPGLLDGPARAALAAAHIALPPSWRASEDELFAAASSRADETLVFSRPRFDADGKRRAPSHFFPVDGEQYESTFVEAARAASLPELAVAASRAWPGRALRPAGFTPWEAVRRAAAVESLRLTFQPAERYEGRVDPALAATIAGPEVRWSASRLESYVVCGFAHFASYGLRLAGLDRELEGADALVLGTVVHEILDEALRPLVEAGQPLDSSTLPGVLDRVASAGRRCWEEAPARYGFGRAGLWRLRWSVAGQRLARMLRAEAEASERLGIERVAGTEYQLETDLPADPPLPFRGAIDRLDLGSGLAVVVDYKTGGQIPRRDLESAARLQLQLYAAAVMAQERGVRRVIARFACLRPVEPVEIDSVADTALVASALARARDVRDRVAAGHFEVMPGPFAEDPARRECPSFCEFRHICRVTPLSRWKEWP